MKLIEKLNGQLSAVGATLDQTPYTLHLDAPSGYVWKANDLPSYAIQYANNSQSWLAAALRSEMPALKLGLRKVTDAAELAEFRHSLDDDAWGAPETAPDFIQFPWR